MKTKILRASRFTFYFPYVWVPLLVIGFYALRVNGAKERYFGLHEPSYLICVLAIGTGVCLLGLGSFVRQLAAANEELANEVKLQNERIWRLEDTLADLKGTRQRAD